MIDVVAQSFIDTAKTTNTLTAISWREALFDPLVGHASPRSNNVYSEERTASNLGSGRLPGSEAPSGQVPAF